MVWLHSLKGTANAPENGWSENYFIYFPFGIAYFQAMLVSGSVRFFFSLWEFPGYSVHEILKFHVCRG